MPHAKNYYEILGVAFDVSLNEINKAYRKLALQYHPDKNTNKSAEEQVKAQAMFKLINEANEILRDSNKRQEYNDKLIAEKNINVADNKNAKINDKNQNSTYFPKKFQDFFANINKSFINMLTEYEKLYNYAHKNEPINIQNDIQDISKSLEDFRNRANANIFADERVYDKKVMKFPGNVDVMIEQDQSLGFKCTSITIKAPANSPIWESLHSSLGFGLDQFEKYHPQSLKNNTKEQLKALKTSPLSFEINDNKNSETPAVKHKL